MTRNMYSKKEHVHIQAIFFFLGAWQKNPKINHNMLWKLYIHDLKVYLCRM